LKLDERLEIAVEIAHESGTILLAHFEAGDVESLAKGERDVVTAADLASEALVVRRLREAFPRDGIVAEEGTEVASQTGKIWYIDPLDGTLNFSRGIPIWCVSLGLMDGGRPVLGVIHDPIRGETFRAVAGSGAWLGNRASPDPVGRAREADPTFGPKVGLRPQGGAVPRRPRQLQKGRLRTSESTSLSSAVVHVTIDFNERSMVDGLVDIQKLVPEVLRTRNIGSAALALAYVAAGRFDAMLHRFAHSWDYVAGVAMLLEAGGSVSDFSGQAFGVETTAIVAGANGIIHGSLLDLVRSGAT
jgi:myo-inositol-1(or 4)-monophosphatase